MEIQTEMDKQIKSLEEMLSQLDATPSQIARILSRVRWSGNLEWEQAYWIKDADSGVILVDMNNLVYKFGTHGGLKVDKLPKN
jgi:hypothetical protein